MGTLFNCSSSHKSLSASLLATLEPRRSLPTNALQAGLRRGLCGIGLFCSLVTLERGARFVLKHFLGGMQHFVLV